MNNLKSIKRADRVLLGLCLPLVLLLAMLMVGCKENSFEVTEYNIKLLAKPEILRLPITQKYMDKHMSIDGYSRKRKLRNYVPHSDKHMSIDGYSRHYEYNNYDYDNRKQRQEFLKREDFRGINLKGTIRNNTDEIIESSDLTARIIFKFKNTQYYYLKPYILVGGNNTWNPSEPRPFNLNVIPTYASGGDVKALSIHTPESVRMELYLTATNSVGYENFDRSIKISEIYKKYDSEKYYGKFMDYNLSDNQILSLGQKIFDKDITDVWNKKAVLSSSRNRGDNSNLFNQTEIDSKYLSNSLVTGDTPYSLYYGRSMDCDFAYRLSSIRYYSSYSCSQIKVEVGAFDVVVIVKKNDVVVTHAYIRASGHYTFDLDNGTYQVFFYSGKGWNPEKEMKGGEMRGGFVADESFGKDVPQSLHEQALTYTLVSLSNGNFSTKRSNPEEAL